MLPPLPPHVSYVTCKQIERERLGEPQVGKPVRQRQRLWQRVCGSCGTRLVHWGERLLAAAQPAPGVAEHVQWEGRPSM